MKALFYVFFLMVSIAIKGQSYSWAWNDTTNFQSDGKALAKDGTGNIFIAETYTPTYVFPGGEHEVKKAIRLTKQQNTAPLWTKNILSSWRLDQVSLATDGNGNIYVCTSFFDTLIVDNTVLVNSGYDINMVLIKFNAQGNLLWTKTTLGKSWGRSVVCDASNNVYVLGNVGGTCYFDNNFAINNPPVGYAFVVKYNSNGVQQWVINNTGYAVEEPKIHVDSNGDCYLIGNMGSHITIGTTTVTAFGYPDLLIAKLNANGQILWATHAGGNNGSSEMRNRGSYIDNNFLYLTGYTGCTTTHFGTVTVNGSNDGSYLAKYDLNGNCVWAKSCGTGNAGTSGNAVCCDQFGNVFVTTSNHFIIKYDPFGTQLWLDNKTVQACAILHDGVDKVYLTGAHTTNLSFGNSPLQMNSNNLRQMYVVALKDEDTPTNVQTSQIDERLMCSLLPNPAAENVTIKFYGKPMSGYIVITDCTGKTIFNTMLSNCFECQINVRKFNSGLYLVEVFDDKSSRLAVKKLIVQ